MHGFHVHQNADCAAGVKDGKATPQAATMTRQEPGSTRDRRAKAIWATSRLKMADVKGPDPCRRRQLF